MDKKTILVVEDVLINRYIIRQILCDENYEIIEASDGCEAMAKFERRIGEIDAILLDVVMPKMNGFEFMEKYIKKGYNMCTPVILITAESGMEVERKGLEMGAVEIIHKPLDAHIVQMRLRNVINMFGQNRRLRELNEEMKAAHERELAYLQAKYEAEEANKAKSNFLARMSHEIRTPMNAIIGLSDITLREELPDKVRENLTMLNSSAKGLLGIINDILDISRIEAGKMQIIPEEYRFSRVLDDMKFMASTLIMDKPVELICSISDDIPDLLYGDQVRIRQILINILTNAVKYTYRGRIEFNVSWEDRKNTAWIKFQVRDSGIGIKQQHLDHIFDDFVRIDELGNKNIEGTGLGLAICRKLVELMEGTISVESKYGKGSVFTVELPQKIVSRDNKISKNTQEEKQSESGDRTKLEGVHILSVDDDRINQKVMAGYLEQFGVRVDIAMSGAECLIKSREQKYDLIFMDYVMPEMDGIQTLNGLKKLKGFDTPVVALTANAIRGAKEEYLQMGFRGYLSKPIDIKELEACLKDFVGGMVEHNMSDSTETIDEDAELPKNGVIERFDRHLSSLGIELIPFLNERGITLDDYMEMLEMFVNDSKLRIKQSDDYITAKNTEAFRVRMHTLKTDALIVGSTELHEKAKKIEKEILDGNVDYVYNNWKVLKIIWENTIKCMDDFLTSSE